MAALACALAVGTGLWLLTIRPHRPTPPRRPGRPAHPAAMAGGATAGALGGWLLTGWPAAALLAGVLGGLVPGGVRAHHATRRAAAQTEALAEAAAGLRDAVNAGHGLQAALASLARYGPPVLRDEFEHLARTARLRGLPTALGELAERLNHPLADLLVHLLVLNARLGSRHLARSLDALAGAIRAEAATLREVHARQAEQRLSARIVAATPPVCLLAFNAANPALLAAYDTLPGQLVLAAAGGLDAAGYWLTVHLAKPPAGIRLAATASHHARRQREGGRS